MLHIFARKSSVLTRHLKSSVRNNSIMSLAQSKQWPGMNSIKALIGNQNLSPQTTQDAFQHGVASMAMKQRDASLAAFEKVRYFDEPHGLYTAASNCLTALVYAETKLHNLAYVHLQHAFDRIATLKPGEENNLLLQFSAVCLDEHLKKYYSMPVLAQAKRSFPNSDQYVIWEKLWSQISERDKMQNAILAVSNGGESDIPEEAFYAGLGYKSPDFVAESLYYFNLALKLEVGPWEKDFTAASYWQLADLLHRYNNNDDNSVEPYKYLLHGMIELLNIEPNRMSELIGLRYCALNQKRSMYLEEEQSKVRSVRQSRQRWLGFP